MNLPPRASLVLGLFSVACTGGPQTADSPAPSLPAGHPIIEAPKLETEGGAGSEETTGVVRETLDGGGYLYARIDFGGMERWVAGPPTPLAVGDTVTIPDMVSMGAFASPTLGRSFEELFFTGGFQPSGAGPAEGAFRHKGTVTQAIPSGSYVYLEVDRDDGTLWLAAPLAEVEVGDSIGWNGGTEMGSFTSPSLGRTFEAIVFVQGVTVLG